MDKMGWLVDRRARRLVWFGGVLVTVVAVVAAAAVIFRPASPARESATARASQPGSGKSAP